MSLTTWRKELEKATAQDGEDFTKLVFAIDEGGLDNEFDDGFGGSEGVPFTAWGEKWVYFPIVYDGSEWVGHAPRNPCDLQMSHQGGE